MGALSTIKNNSGFSDAKTAAIFRDQMLSGGFNRQLFIDREVREVEKEGQVLTSSFKEEEVGASTETMLRQKQPQSNINWGIEDRLSDSTDLQSDERPLESRTESYLALDIDSQFLTEEPSSSLLEQKFQRLVKQWREETFFLSSSTEKMMHPSYQRIIGMGPTVLPLLLRELQELGGHWFWALRAITEEDPVNPQDVGHIRKMTEAWLQWGKQNHLL